MLVFFKKPKQQSWDHLNTGSLVSPEKHQRARKCSCLLPWGSPGLAHQSLSCAELAHSLSVQPSVCLTFLQEVSTLSTPLPTPHNELVLPTFPISSGSVPWQHSFPKPRAMKLSSQILSALVFSFGKMSDSSLSSHCLHTLTGVHVH